MKLKTLFIIAAAATALQFTPTASAQPRDGQDNWRRGGERRAKLLASLSVDERGKLRAARQKAMGDPAVQAAKDRLRQAAKDFREAKRSAMLRADPTIQPILDKIPAPGRRDS